MRTRQGARQGARRATCSRPSPFVEQGSDNNGAIIFIDELDAVGTKRFDSELSGDREVQRTMLELLNQLDGFSSEDRIKVPGAPLPLPLHAPVFVRVTPV